MQVIAEPLLRKAALTPNILRISQYIEYTVMLGATQGFKLAILYLLCYILHSV